MGKFSVAAVAAAIGLACASQAGAMALVFANGVSDHASSSIASCISPFTNGVYQNCVTNGFISDAIATNTDHFMNLDTFGGGGQGVGQESFTSAFGNYATLSGVNWILQADNTDALADITMTVTSFNTESKGAVSGIGSIKVDLSGVSQSMLDQLVWIQALEINYKPGPAPDGFSTETNYNTLDDATFNSLTSTCNAIPGGSPAIVPAQPFPTATEYCDPIYPFQYEDKTFYDGPLGPWPNGSFRGIAMLASIDTVNHVVTTYGGVSYGFDSSVAPEPGAWTLLLAGLGAIVIARRRVMPRG
jgi:hypothetical protein